MKAGGDIKTLLAIMARLRDRKGGCPWDLEQDFKTIAPYTLEEAYEVADAIDRADKAALKDELGDLLFQVVYHARMAEEEGAFDFAGVVKAVSEKMIRRHPHIFGDEKNIKTASHQTTAWEGHKAGERAAKNESLLGGVPLALPALKRAEKLQRRAARAGFDWKEAKPILDKIREETAELAAEMEKSPAPAETAEELGDLLFAVVNLARHLDIDAEEALRQTNIKFVTRFRFMEVEAKRQGKALEDMSLEEMEGLWQKAKG
ncbi:MAG TPA: nucleoside triphosphate pyrophosphohydrolase [Sphingomonadales bacterium]|nr:nucleoside triphosphate pyrophosphohydrolase [Sphingomonadales bacterium]